MPYPTNPAIFDGHNDLLLRLYQEGGGDALQTVIDGRDGHIDLPRARRGGFGGGFFAVFVPNPGEVDVIRKDEMTKARYDVPLPDPIPQSDALAVVMAQVAILYRLEAMGALRVCRQVSEIRETLDADAMAAIFHIEGAEAIGPDLDALDVLHTAGLRSLGPVWSRPTIFGDGVPFRFPSDGDIGDGLTEAGKDLVRRCNALKIMVDLSHLNMAGFWDVAKISDAPLVATHSNAHAITPHARNLTDDQLRAIADSDGMVGLNYAAAFLRTDGRMDEDVPLEQMLRHIDHLMSLLGEDHVGLGSDFDGAIVPKTLDSAAGLPKLREAMAQRGYGDALIAKLCHGNWMRVLERTWA